MASLLLQRNLTQVISKPCGRHRCQVDPGVTDVRWTLESQVSGGLWRHRCQVDPVGALVPVMCLPFPLSHHVWRGLPSHLDYRNGLLQGFPNLLWILDYGNYFNVNSAIFLLCSKLLNFFSEWNSPSCCYYGDLRDEVWSTSVTSSTWFCISLSFNSPASASRVPGSKAWATLSWLFCVLSSPQVWSSLRVACLGVLFRFYVPGSRMFDAW